MFKKVRGMHEGHAFLLSLSHLLTIIFVTQIIGNKVTKIFGTKDLSETLKL